MVFLLSVFNGLAQTDEKPVLERYSSSTSEKNKEESNVVPELKRSDVSTTNNTSRSNTTEQLIVPELKRSDSQPTKKEQPKNN